MRATGLRISEAAAVVWGDVDLQRRTVAVRGNVVRVKGKGLVVQSDESSKLTVRTLVLPEWAAELLRQRYDAESCPASRPVFSAPKGGLRDPSNTQADLRAAFTECGYEWVDEPRLPQDSRLADGRRWQDSPSSRRPARAQPAEPESKQIYGPARDE